MSNTNMNRLDLADDYLYVVDMMLPSEVSAVCLKYSLCFDLNIHCINIVVVMPLLISNKLRRDNICQMRTLLNTRH